MSTFLRPSLLYPMFTFPSSLPPFISPSPPSPSPSLPQRHHAGFLLPLPLPPALAHPCPHGYQRLCHRCGSMPGHGNRHQDRRTVRKKAREEGRREGGREGGRERVQRERTWLFTRRSHVHTTQGCEAGLHICHSGPPSGTSSMPFLLPCVLVLATGLSPLFPSPLVLPSSAHYPPPPSFPPSHRAWPAHSSFLVSCLSRLPAACF